MAVDAHPRHKDVLGLRVVTLVLGLDAHHKVEDIVVLQQRKHLGESAFALLQHVDLARVLGTVAQQHPVDAFLAGVIHTGDRLARLALVHKAEALKAARRRTTASGSGRLLLGVALRQQLGADQLLHQQIVAELLGGQRLQLAGDGQHPRAGLVHRQTVLSAAGAQHRLGLLAHPGHAHHLGRGVRTFTLHRDTDQQVVAVIFFQFGKSFVKATLTLALEVDGVLNSSLITEHDPVHRAITECFESSLCLVGVLKDGISHGFWDNKYE
mmetsp:Transcript_30771/g.77215  ORF Transcript_30771/g.77215 Transcript_30771/m.77215 type:complete len:268 (+) Transcript_30771:1314-2117(+)